MTATNIGACWWRYSPLVIHVLVFVTSVLSQRDKLKKAEKYPFDCLQKSSLVYLRVAKRLFFTFQPEWAHGHSSYQKVIQCTSSRMTFTHATWEEAKQCG